MSDQLHSQFPPFVHNLARVVCSHFLHFTLLLFAFLSLSFAILPALEHSDLPVRSFAATIPGRYMCVGRRTMPHGRLHSLKNRRLRLVHNFCLLSWPAVPPPYLLTLWHPQSCNLALNASQPSLALIWKEKVSPLISQPSR